MTSYDVTVTSYDVTFFKVALGISCYKSYKVQTFKFALDCRILSFKMIIIIKRRHIFCNFSRILVKICVKKYIFTPDTHPLLYKRPFILLYFGRKWRHLLVVQMYQGIIYTFVFRTFKPPTPPHTRPLRLLLCYPPGFERSLGSNYTQMQP